MNHDHWLKTWPKKLLNKSNSHSFIGHRFTELSVIRHGFTACFILSLSMFSQAEVDWVSVTTDNDLFVGNDNGYTNGIFVAWFDIGGTTSPTPKHDFWVTPLMWSMPKKGIRAGINAYMLGQAMLTPSDITISDPDEKELPYSSLLAMTNSYVALNTRYADRVSATIGIVGPSALGEESQKLVHKLLGSDKPQGWHTQLQDELVFQFSRARAWRKWVSESGSFDFLITTELSVGTIESSINSGMTIRYGRDLSDSYATMLFISSRTVNPSAINGGWYIYAGIQPGYIFNQVFADGNTFRNSRSIDYDHEFIGLTTGLAYSWQHYSLALAISDMNLIQDAGRNKELEDLTRFGTLTFAWKM